MSDFGNVSWTFILSERPLIQNETFSVCIRHVRIFSILWPITKRLAAENYYIYSWNKACIDSLSDFISVQRVALNALKH